ncbi:MULTISPECIES: LysR substrate-binding domain-containing protein [Mycobacterium]|jgi:DNA-binding transcriptional LysR family regulator|uniref:LysR substrate-binding domain-containing protein n=1 Tax=Mycobacterium TaxID=1763 RepID=UPI001981AE5D|nr:MULTISPECIES: LysR substrate-binding domain-containing protein [Mycobacterium]
MTSGLQRTDAAFVWLPLPRPESYQWLQVATELRMVALPPKHRLADRDTIAFTDLLDEPCVRRPRAADVKFNARHPVLHRNVPAGTI